ncbi:MAG TPA: hypothetical protein VKQ52_17490, partial [Puia sp.]|nr:hypothetical protein [Puia sp.]
RAAAFTEASALRRTGFIAQEVEQAAGEAGYDFTGVSRPKNEHDHYSLDYQAFIMPMVKAMQEQQKMIETLKGQNDEQQKRLDAMQAELDAIKAKMR